MARQVLQSLRALRRNPGFSILVVAVLAIGMGANAALYSIIDRVVLHPFVYRDPGRLVAVLGLDGKGRDTGVSPAEFKYWQGRVPAFEESAMWRWRDLMLTGVENPESMMALQVSARTFDILGVPPLHGRLFRPDDFRKDAAPVVVIGYRFWQRHFNGDPALIGRQVLLDGQGYTVIGIMGPGFMFNQPGIEVWTPLNPFQRIDEDLHHGYSAMARLRPGAIIEQAQQQLNAITPLIPQSPTERHGWHARLMPYVDQSVGNYRRALYVLWGAVLFVMLIACANAANLLLARASNRRREFAVRASLGAGRFALVRQFLGESLLLGIAAGAAGIGIAAALFRLLVTMFPNQVAFIHPEKLALTPAALVVTSIAVLATTVLSALPSCWDLVRSNLGAALQASRGASADRVTNRTRSVLVAFEVALSVALLAGAGVMIQSLSRLSKVPLGFNPDHVLTARVSAPPQLKDKRKLNEYFNRVLSQVETIPGVRSAAMVTVMPLGNLMATTSLTVEGRPVNPADPEWHTYSVRLRSVTPDYFKTMGVRILRGRPFTAHDVTNSAGVAIVNEELARHYWPGRDPIGKRVSRDSTPGAGDWLTVVGVIESAQDGSLRDKPGAELYCPYSQDITAARANSLLVRTYGDPLSVASAIRKRVHAIDPDQPVTQIQTMDAWVRQALAQPRFNTVLLEIFAGLAFTLAASGVFAVVSYAVTQRAHEIGIRSALGATAKDIVRFVSGLGLRPVVAGALLGVAGAAVATRALKSQLYETSPLDPVVFAIALALLLGAAVAATLIPARRAARIDPAITLRSE